MINRSVLAVVLSIGMLISPLPNGENIGIASAIIPPSAQNLVLTAAEEKVYIDENFDACESGEIIRSAGKPAGAEAADPMPDPVSIGQLVLRAGQRGNGPLNCFAGIAEADGGKYLDINEDGYATAGRGISFTFNYGEEQLPSVSELQSAGAVLELGMDVSSTQGFTINGFGTVPAVTGVRVRAVIDAVSNMQYVIMTDGEGNLVSSSVQPLTATGFVGAEFYEADTKAQIDNIRVVSKAADLGLVTVSVKDGENALADADVTVGAVTVKTNAAGEAMFALPNGTYSVKASKTGYEHTAGMADDAVEEITVESAAKAVTLTLSAQSYDKYVGEVSVNGGQSFLAAPKEAEPARSAAFTVSVLDQNGILMNPGEYGVNWSVYPAGTKAADPNVTIDENGVVSVAQAFYAENGAALYEVSAEAFTEDKYEHAEKTIYIGNCNVIYYDPVNWEIAAGTRAETKMLNEAAVLPEIADVTLNIEYKSAPDNHSSIALLSNGGRLTGIQTTNDLTMTAWTGWSSSSMNQSGDLGKFGNSGVISTGSASAKITYTINRKNQTITVSCGTEKVSLPFDVSADTLTGFEYGLYRTRSNVVVKDILIEEPDTEYLAINGDADFAKISGRTVSRSYVLGQTTVNPEETFRWNVTGDDITGISVADGVLSVTDGAKAGVYTLTAASNLNPAKTADLRVEIGDFQTIDPGQAVISGAGALTLGGDGDTYSVVTAIDSYGDDVAELLPAAKWTSSNAGVVSITEDGRATAVGSGTATLTATITNGNAVSTFTKQVTVAAYYIVMNATGNTTSVDTSALVNNEFVTGYQVTTSRNGVLVRQTVEQTAPVSVDTTGADKLEIAPVFFYDMGVVGEYGQTGAGYDIAIPAGTYNFVVTNTSGNRCDVYMNDQMLVNNILQDGSAVKSLEVKDIVVAGGIAKIATTDYSSGKNANSVYIQVQVVKSPSIVDRAKKIYVLGDSLVCIYYNGGNASNNYKTGWGQVLSDYLVDSVDVVNLANSGARAKTLADTAFSQIRGSAQSGDILLLESGYNDRTYDTKEVMMAAVTEMVNAAKAKGMDVILVSPNASKKTYNESVSWTANMAEAAVSTGSVYVNLSKMSYDFLVANYGTNGADVPSDYTVSDNLHATYNGANKWASLVAGSLYEQGYQDIVNEDHVYTFTDALGNVITCSATGKTADSGSGEDPAGGIWYSQDFSAVTDASTVATSTNAQQNLVIAQDDVHGNYLSFAPGLQNSRGAYMNFAGVDVTGESSYIVEFDACITPGNNQQTYLTVKGTDFADNGGINSGTKSGYLMNLVNTAGGSTEYMLNGTTKVTIPSGEWCHYKLYVDKNRKLVSTSITGTSTGSILDKEAAAYSGEGNAAGMYMLAGRYYAVQGLDNIVVRKADADDQFGEAGNETLSGAAFKTQLNTVIAAPGEGQAVHMPIQITTEGNLGGSLDDKVTVEWSAAGLDNEDGYISLTRAEGTGSGTEGAAPNGTTAYFNVRNGVSSYFGYVQAVVSYGEDSYTLKTPFAVISASANADRLAPAAGYPADMNDYVDSLAGYQGTAYGIKDRDIVLNNWSIYGSNGARTMKLVKDGDGTKSLEFASNGGSGSTVAVYQWADQANQYVIDFTARFTSSMAFGVYYNTPNNSNNRPEWTASYASGELTLGTEHITGINANEWYRFVVSADASVQKVSVTVYNSADVKVGEINDMEMANDDAVQKYFCFQGTWPMYLRKFEAYKPVLSAMTVGAGTDVVRVPENGENAATVELSANLTSAEGVKMTGAVTWSLAEDYANVEIEPTGAQTALLKVQAGASGAVTVVATKDSTQAEKVIQLTTSSNVVAFTQSTSSVTIPFAGEAAVVSRFRAETRNGSGNVIDGGAISYALLAKDGVTETTVKGVTFENGVLTVAAGASPAVVYVKAVNAEGLSAKVKVNIHGLSFAFGSSDAADGFTQVADTLYTEKLGYGFWKTAGLTVNGDNVAGTEAFRFKVNVPDGNYVVKVDTTAASMTSEVVESVPAATGIQKTGNTFNVAVCDGVLDVTFPAGASVKTFEISQAPVKTRQAKPYVYTIGDSTTRNNANGALSWGNCVEGGKAAVPDVFGGFANHGMAGRNSVSYYNEGRVEAVLLAICPGDYVTVNMGINTGDSEPASYYTLLSSYYVEGILQRGGIPVIVTATPDGPVGNRVSMNYDAATGKFTNSRGDTVRNDTLRQIAAEKNLHLIELGQWGQDWMNTLTMDDVAAYNAANNTAYTSVLEMVQSWYVDHNHYKEYLGIQIGNYILGELADIAVE